MFYTSKQITLLTIRAASTAVLLNTILFLIAQNQQWVTSAYVLPSNQPLTLLAVVLASVIPCIIASVIYYVGQKFFKTNTWFNWLSVTVFVFSLVSIAILKNAPISLQIVLVCMHVIVAYSVVTTLTAQHNSK
jgi:hypothetical protein